MGTISTAKTKNRILFADLLKVVGISFVVLEHVYATNFYPQLNPYYISISLFNGMFVYNYGLIGVTLFIFASGLCLTLSHPRIANTTELTSFYKKRLLRIYPAYWTALLLFVSLNQSLLKQSFSMLDVAKLISGYNCIGAVTWQQYMGKISVVFWFIPVILSLYLAFPLILLCINKYPNITIIGLLAVTVISRWYMACYSPFIDGTEWFVGCQILFFGLGIFMAKKHLYPNFPSSRVPAFLSDLSFYVYLVNGTALLALTIYPTLYLVALFVFAYMLLLFDNSIKQYLQKRSAKTRT